MVRSMTSGNPIRLMLTFMIPLLIGNLFQQFYNIADVIIVGRTIGVEALAAVGATAPLFMALLGATIGLSAGFTVVTGQRFGAGDWDGVRRSFAMSLLLSVAFNIVFSVVTAGCMPQIMRLMNISATLYDNAYHYILIIVYGLGAMMVYNLLSYICRALGDSKTPLYFLILASILNIILALVFITVFGWGVPGSAIALIIAQSVAAITCWLYMRRQFPMLRLRRQDWHWNTAFAWQHLRLGLPMAVQFIIISLGILAIQSVCNTFGPETIAGFVSATRMEQLALQPMISFGIAMAVYTAQNYGAGKYDRIRQGVRQCSLLSLVFCAIAAGAMFALGKDLVSLFTTKQDPELLADAMLYIHTSVPCYIFLGQIFVFRNALQGMGISSVPLISSLLELVGRGGAAFGLAAVWGYFGICLSSPLCWLLACAFTGGCYYYVQREMKRAGR